MKVKLAVFHGEYRHLVFSVRPLICHIAGYSKKTTEKEFNAYFEKLLNWGISNFLVWAASFDMFTPIYSMHGREKIFKAITSDIP